MATGTYSSPPLPLKNSNELGLFSRHKLLTWFGWIVSFWGGLGGLVGWGRGASKSAFKWIQFNRPLLLPPPCICAKCTEYTILDASLLFCKYFHFIPFPRIAVLHFRCLRLSPTKITCTYDAGKNPVWLLLVPLITTNNSVSLCDLNDINEGCWLIMMELKHAKNKPVKLII